MWRLNGLALVAVTSAPASSSASASASASPCLTDDELGRIAAAGQRALEQGRGGARYEVASKGSLGNFDFSFAPANYTHAGI